MSSNSDQQAVERRLAAVERAIDGRTQEALDTPPVDREPMENRLADLEQRVDELDAALQAVRGFLGGVDAVNEGVEARADSAIAAVDRLERRLDRAGLERTQRERDDKPDDVGDSCAEEEQKVQKAPEEPPEDGRVPDDQAPSDEQDQTLRNRLNGQW